MVKVPAATRDLLQTIHDAIEEWKALQGGCPQDLPNLHFDRHLYLPLLIAKASKTPRYHPPALNDGEGKFVDDLMTYCKSGPPA